MEYFAHSENDKNKKHLLSKHLSRTAEIAAGFVCDERYRQLFKDAGLLHDLGKYQVEFQRYLENGGVRGSVPHASWGAGYARIKGVNEVSIAVDGHHKGLPDKATWKNDTEPFKQNEVAGFCGVVKDFYEDMGVEEKDIVLNKIFNLDDQLQREFFIRYLFSALVDADWLSTEEHFDQEKFSARADSVLDIDKMLHRLNDVFSQKPKSGEVNRLRNEAKEEVLRKKAFPPGFYSLSLPTGMGKTLTSMAWALNHAKHNKLKRIIIVLPYINIIDQTAQILKDIFGEELVLEHHSSYSEDDEKVKDAFEDCTALQKRKKLACENWDYPIVVTTTVQFFESLFSRKPSKCRKVHSIAESVVIFDEIQALPKEILLPTVTMLKNVQAVMKTSFLFCTATQPAFEKRKNFDGIENIVSLIDDPARLYGQTRRVDYNLLNGLRDIDLDDLSAAVAQSSGAALVIFNTKKSVLEFYEKTCKKDGWDKVYHLSTSMCPAHRKATISDIRQDLEAKKKILVVSTQLIEAGVDFDFPVVFRAVAPLEAVIQSAGRCNREGKLAGRGSVYLFNLKNSGMPDKTYAACAGYASGIIRADADSLYRHDVFTKYHREVVSLFSDSDKYKINQAREAFNFEVVGDAYRIIRNVTHGLYVCNYSDESRQLLDFISRKEFLSKDDYRNMQKFTVLVYQRFIQQNSKSCKVLPQGFMVWYGNYHNATGISTEPIEADKLIV